MREKHHSKINNTKVVKQINSMSEKEEEEQTCLILPTLHNSLINTTYLAHFVSPLGCQAATTPDQGTDR